MESLSLDVLRQVLQYLSLCQIGAFSMSSRRINQLIAIAINVHRPAGKMWWEAKLIRDSSFNGEVAWIEASAYIPNLATLANPAEIYVIKMMPLVPLTIFGSLYSPMVLTIVALRRIRAENIIELMDLGYPLLGWQQWLRNPRRDRSTIIPVTAQRPGAFLWLVTDPATPSEVLDWVVDLALENQTPTMLQVFWEILQNPQFDISREQYKILRDTVFHRSPTMVAMVLQMLPIDPRTGKRIGVDATDGYALYTAATNGDAEIVRVLLEAGANPHAHHDKAMSEALWKGRADIVRLLVGSPRFTRAVVKTIPVGKLSRDDKAYIQQLRVSGKLLLPEEAHLHPVH